MKFYSEEQIAKFQKIYKNRLVFLIVFASLSLIFVIVSCFFLNDNNILFFKIFDSVLVSLSLCVIFYNLINYIYPSKRIIEHIQFVMVSNYEELSGEVTEIKERKTIKQDVVVKQILLKTDEKEIYINYNLMCNQKPINIRDKIKVNVASTFIIDEVDAND